MKNITIALLISSTLLFADKFDTMKKLEDDIYLKNKEINLKDVQENINSHNFENNLSKIYDSVLKNVDIETRRLQGENVSIDNLTTLKNKKTSNDDIKSFLQNNRIYIFMSQSVPMDIWHTYGKLIYDKKLTNTSMVLRGCIGGSCTKIAPTGEFIVKLKKYDKNSEISPNIIIDPLLFRKYNISQVPCVVFAQDTQTKDLALSEGIAENFNAKKTYKSCGAWNLLWHLKQLQQEANSLELEQIIDYLEPKGGL